MTINFALVLPTDADESWTLAKQMGVTYAIARLPHVEGDTKPWDYQPLMHHTQRLRDAGFEVVGFEDIVPPMDRIRLGTDVQRGLAEVKRLVRNLGALDVPLWCYNWMAGFNWLRTSTALPDRGNSLVTAYDHDLIRDAPHTDVGRVRAMDLWDRLERFLDEVIPVAEEAGVKLALHPDDPPISPVQGIDRIVTGVDAYERVFEYAPSEYNGVTLCQGNFAAMGTDIPSIARQFDDRLHYVHFRDVEGTPEKFRETWHDDGPTDMLAAMEAYRDIGFDGPIRPDHVPTMAGEANENPGYEWKGRLFAIGYMKGLAEAVHGD